MFCCGGAGACSGLHMAKLKHLSSDGAGPGIVAGACSGLHIAKSPESLELAPAWHMAILKHVTHVLLGLAPESLELAAPACTLQSPRIAGVCSSLHIAKLD